MSAGAQAVIEARGLRIEVGAHLLLRDIALSISVGERVALVGRNGAGKSTLLRALTGFGELGRLPRERLRVLGTDLADAHRREVLRTLRARVAQVHQSLHLVGRLSALDNVLIGMHTRLHTGALGAILRTRKVKQEETEARHRAATQ